MTVFHRSKNQLADLAYYFKKMSAPDPKAASR
jgi:hypothetical protein